MMGVLPGLRRCLRRIPLPCWGELEGLRQVRVLVKVFARTQAQRQLWALVLVPVATEQGETRVQLAPTLGRSSE